MVRRAGRDGRGHRPGRAVAGQRPADDARVSEPHGVGHLADPLPAGQFDLVYDSGCFHHLAPHRRITYLERVLPAVRAGGRFGIVTFAAGRVETPTDLEVVTTGDTGGGMAFSLEDLRTIFAPLHPLEVRPVHPNREGTFGADFLNAALFTTTK